MKRLCYVLATSVVALLAANSASAASIINGSFETGTDPGSFTTVFPGQNNIMGWTVGGVGGVDYIGSYWQAAAGVRSVDLSGNGPGSVSQDVATVIGQTYKLNFSLAGNPDGGDVLKLLVTSVGGSVPQLSFFSTAGSTHSNMHWTNASYVFTAFSNISTLTFASGTNSAYGPALDNVSISAVPETATWAMMLAGFGMIGFAARRRSRVKTKVTYA